MGSVRPSVPAVAGGTTPGSGPGAVLDQARRLVEQAVSRLDELGEDDPGAHVAVLDGVHRSLQDALAALDEA